MFTKRKSIKQIEEGKELAPKFDKTGLIPVITTDFKNGNVLMHGYMNRQALKKTIETGEVYYWSRSRKTIWHKGATSGFIQKLKEIRNSENYSSDYNVRVKVKGGGCSGLMYDLNFDNKISDDDNFFEDNNIKIIVDKKSLFYVLGTELDFSDGLNGKGFQFKNPNATRTCGCGESFAV